MGQCYKTFADYCILASEDHVNHIYITARFRTRKKLHLLCFINLSFTQIKNNCPLIRDVDDLQNIIKCTLMATNGPCELGRRLNVDLFTTRATKLYRVFKES